MSAPPFTPPPGLVRVVAIGSESTGKTELTAWLARELGVPWSAEFAREYAELRGGGELLSAADVEPIAHGQLGVEQQAIARAVALRERLVLHDTDLLSTLVYATAYYGESAAPRWAHALLADRAPALYLLCDIDIPWRGDAVRDAAADREEMQRRFATALDVRGVGYIVIRGSEGERRQRALEAIRRLR